MQRALVAGSFSSRDRLAAPRVAGTAGTVGTQDLGGRDADDAPSPSPAPGCLHALLANETTAEQAGPTGALSVTSPSVSKPSV